MQHIVLFHFPERLSPELEEEMAAQVREWPEKIGGFTRLRFGADVSGRSRGYQYALFAEFENEERMREYFPHPVHRAFADWVHERGSEELAFDYPVTDQSLILGD
jgi:hypothetical protein